MRALARLDAYQRRRKWLGLPLGVFYKFFDDRGPYLAALVTYYGFLSLFPLLLLFFSAAGFFLQGHAHLRGDIEHSALQNFPVIGPQLRGSLGHGVRGSGTALVVGIVGTLYGGTGAMQAAQAAFNRIYGVPRNEQPNPFKSRVRSVALLCLLGSAVLLATGLSAAVSTANGLSRHLGPVWHVAGYLLSFAVNTALFTAAFQLLTARELHPRQVLRGGLLAAAAWVALQSAGSAIVTHSLSHASELYGTFALVLGTIVWIYLQVLALVLAAEVNVVVEHRLWPRALLTPFTDAVQLTSADRRAYRMYAVSERYKGFERVDTEFGYPPAEEAPKATTRPRRWRGLLPARRARLGPRADSPLDGDKP